MDSRVFITTAVLVPSLAVLYYFFHRKTALSVDDDDSYGSLKEAELRRSERRSVQFQVHPRFVGAIIGHGGSVIRDIERRSGARLHLQAPTNAEKLPVSPVPLENENGEIDQPEQIKFSERILTIRGTEEEIRYAEIAVRKAIIYAPVAVSEVMEIPTRYVGKIIGPRGESIAYIKTESGARIDIDRKSKSSSSAAHPVPDDVPTGANTQSESEEAEEVEADVQPHENSNDIRPKRTKVFLCGTYEQVRSAKSLIVARLHAAFDDYSRYMDRVRYRNAHGKPANANPCKRNVTGGQSNGNQKEIPSQVNTVDVDCESVRSASSSTGKRRPRNEAMASLKAEANADDAADSVMDHQVADAMNRNVVSCGLSHLPVGVSDQDVVVEIDVFVSCVYAPSCLLLQRCDTIAQLDKLNDQITRSYESDSFVFPKTFRFKRGMLVAAPFPAENRRRFYRAVVRKELPETEEVDLLYLDFGDHSRVRCSEVRFLAPSFLNEPIFAIECSLFGATPNPSSDADGCSWSDAAIDHLACLTDAANRKPLLARVRHLQQVAAESTVVAKLCSCDVISSGSGASASSSLISLQNVDLGSGTTRSSKLQRAKVKPKTEKQSDCDDWNEKSLPNSVTFAFLNAFATPASDLKQQQLGLPQVELIDLATGQSVLDQLIEAGYSRHLI